MRERQMAIIDPIWNSKTNKFQYIDVWVCCQVFFSLRLVLGWWTWVTNPLSPRGENTTKGRIPEATSCRCYMQYHAIKFNSAKHLFGIFSLIFACSKIWQSKWPSWETQRSLTSSNVVHHPRLASDSHLCFFLTKFTGTGKIYTWQVRCVLFMFVNLRFVAFLRCIFARFHADL